MLSLMLTTALAFASEGDPAPAAAACVTINRSLNQVSFEFRQSGVPCAKQDRASDAALLPNKALRVVVKAAAAAKVEVRAIGQQGSYASEIDIPREKAENGGDNDGVTRDFTFSPFKPGDVTLLVKAGDAEARYVVHVDRQFAGAVRLGLAASVGAPGVQLDTVPGTAGAGVLRASETSDVRGEVVASYTQYLTPRSESDAWSAGVLVGVRVANLEAAPKVDLRSFYLGADVGWRNLSFAPALQLDGVSEPAAGLEDGDAWTAGTPIPTVTVWQPRFALVVSFPLGMVVSSLGASKQ